MKQTEPVRFILASGSPRRKELLAQIGLYPEVSVSRIDETIATDIPGEAVKELSLQKARHAAQRCGGRALVMGADTVVALDGQIMGKPSSHEEAYSMISRLQGRRHKVFTGVAFIYLEDGGVLLERQLCETTSVWVYPMEEAEIRDYAWSLEPMDKAGAYGIQGGFAAFIEKVEGDYNNVVGLPIGRVYQELKNIQTMIGKSRNKAIESFDLFK